MNRLLSTIIKRMRVEPLGVAMPGARLTERIRTIIEGAAEARISRARASCAIAACAAVAGVVVVAAIAAARPDSRQRQLSAPTFEVASIKRHVTPPAGDTSGGPGCGDDIGRCTPRNATAAELIQFAFDKMWFEVSGGPAWVTSETFDIDATIPEAAMPERRALPREERYEQDRRMMQSLLADRFKLVVRHETKELPIYALVVSKPSANLEEVSGVDTSANGADGSSASGRGGRGNEPEPGDLMQMTGMNGNATLIGKAAHISGLVAMLATRVGRPVVDRTGLTGSYNFRLNWTAAISRTGGQTMMTAGNDGSPDIAGTSIFTALQEQLGLKLESTKGPVDTIVIDHIEEPTAN